MAQPEGEHEVADALTDRDAGLDRIGKVPVEDAPGDVGEQRGAGGGKGFGGEQGKLRAGRAVADGVDETGFVGAGHDGADGW